MYRSIIFVTTSNMHIFITNENTLKLFQDTNHYNYNEFLFIYDDRIYSILVMNYTFIYVNTFLLQLSTGYASAAPRINYQTKIIKSLLHC